MNWIRKKREIKQLEVDRKKFSLRCEFFILFFNDVFNSVHFRELFIKMKALDDLIVSKDNEIYIKCLYLVDFLYRVSLNMIFEE